jgi:hypothetical protein
LYGYSAHELGTNDQPGELLHTEAIETNNEGSLERPVMATNDTVSPKSPHLQAQRRSELDWLKTEEEIMRKELEMLCLQGSGKVDESKER